ncbi:MAG: hypothetical protein F4175_11975, partial [Gemmatimonadetes bacterium]|nr:hypothetical protein [Gemmatimonadota bacterium]
MKRDLDEFICQEVSEIKGTK